MTTKAAMTVQQVATYLSVDPKTVYRMAKSGDLPGFKVRGAWRFRVEDIDNWIEERKRAVRDSGDTDDPQ